MRSAGRQGGQSGRKRQKNGARNTCAADGETCGAGLRSGRSFAASGVTDHAGSGRRGAIARGNFFEFLGKLRQAMGSVAQQFRRGTPGLRQDFAFKKVAYAPRFLFECAYHVF